MKLVLGVTGSVAATLVPKLADDLLAAGHELVIVTTGPGRYFLPAYSPTLMGFVVPAGLRQPGETLQTPAGSFVPVYGDKDEWPAGGYHKEDPVGHIELRSWADCLLIAPLSANSLAKLTFGLADGYLTCIARAWHKERPLVVAPAMNTTMWEDPLTAEQLEALSYRFRRLHVVQPQEKRLACGDVGIGAMAPLEEIIAAVRAASSGVER